MGGEGTGDGRGENWRIGEGRSAGVGRAGQGGECCGVQKILKIDPALKHSVTHAHQLCQTLSFQPTPSKFTRRHVFRFH